MVKKKHPLSSCLHAFKKSKNKVKARRMGRHSYVREKKGGGVPRTRESEGESYEDRVYSGMRTHI
jgi:hypothetical protein